LSPMKRNTSIIILAAGKGVRMKSDLPKVAHLLAGKSLVERVVSTAEHFKPEKIVVVVGYKKNVVIECLSEFDNISFVEQKEQLGTGHAVYVTRDNFKKFDGTVIILPGDVPLLKEKTLENLINVHEEKKAVATVLTVDLNDPTGYGRIVRNDEGYVEKIVEHKDASEEIRKIKEINSGIFCFDAQELFSVLPKIDQDNSQNEMYLTDALELLKKEGKSIAAVKVDDPIEVAGINSKEQLQELEKQYLT